MHVRLVALCYAYVHCNDVMRIKKNDVVCHAVCTQKFCPIAYDKKEKKERQKDIVHIISCIDAS